MRITRLRLRGILDSRAQPTVEAEITVDRRYTGIGSSPRAIAPGRREPGRRANIALGPFDAPDDLLNSLGDLAPADQCSVDHLLHELDVNSGLGADVTLAISLAFARAVAVSASLQLHTYLAAVAGTLPAMPQLLVNIFSGGIHQSEPPVNFQQVMVIPGTGDVAGDIRLSIAVFEQAERLAPGSVLSASSGLLTSLGSEYQLDLLARAVARAGCAGSARMAIDVAAEHLATGTGRYRLGSKELTSSDLAGCLAELVRRWDVTYVEDPFEPDDEAAWHGFRDLVSTGVAVVGDDLSVTDASRIRPDLASGVLLKLSQAGTISMTLDTAARARAAGMLVAISHRSGETEDVSVCDLAVAIGADLIKVGGPRRGDRLAKYNQLLRLRESLSEGKAVNNHFQKGVQHDACPHLPLASERP
jgi:enolase